MVSLSPLLGGAVREVVREVDVFSWRTAVIALVILLAWFLSYTASRLDRLHQKVQSSRAALDAQFARRAAAAMEVAAYLDPASGLLVTDAAASSLSRGDQAALAKPDDDIDPTTPDPLDIPAHLEEVENDLSRVLQVSFDEDEDVAELRDDPFAADAVAVLAQACRRVQLARRFHNDAVAQALRLRYKLVVRWAHLAGRAPLPTMIEIDDEVPRALREI